MDALLSEEEPQPKRKKAMVKKTIHNNAKKYLLLFLIIHEIEIVQPTPNLTTPELGEYVAVLCTKYKDKPLIGKVVAIDEECKHVKEL